LTFNNKAIPKISEIFNTFFNKNQLIHQNLKFESNNHKNTKNRALKPNKQGFYDYLSYKQHLNMVF